MRARGVVPRHAADAQALALAQRVEAQAHVVATLAALRLPFETLGRDADLCARAGGGGDLEEHEGTKLINPLW